MIRNLVGGSLLLALVAVTGWQLAYGSRDLARYNKMREMSDEPPLGAGEHKHETNSAARTTNPFTMLLSLPSDLGRYLKLKSM
jgi:hypothetical protein